MDVYNSKEVKESIFLVEKRKEEEEVKKKRSSSPTGSTSGCSCKSDDGKTTSNVVDEPSISGDQTNDPILVGLILSNTSQGSVAAVI